MILLRILIFFLIPLNLYSSILIEELELKMLEDEKIVNIKSKALKIKSFSSKKHSFNDTRDTFTLDKGIYIIEGSLKIYLSKYPYLLIFNENKQEAIKKIYYSKLNDKESFVRDLFVIDKETKLSIRANGIIYPFSLILKKY